MIINTNAFNGYVYPQSAYSAAHGQRENNLFEESRMVNEIMNKKLRRYNMDVEEGIQRAVNEYGAQVWAQLIDALIPVLTTDIDSVVSIGFDGAKDIFYDKKTQKYISDHYREAALQELQKLKDIKIEIKL